MKRFLLLLTVFGVVFSGYSQKKPAISKELRDVSYTREFVPAIYDINPFNHAVNPTTTNRYEQEEEVIGTTWYDLQTNTALSNRLTRFNDGTMAAVWTYGVESPPNFPDRGTGYNYFDGAEWGPHPTSRVESDRSGWPSVAPFGEDGEIIVSHVSGGTGTGLTFMHRPNKGAGDWTEFNFTGPAGWELILWPRLVTSGVNNEVIHLVHTTAPTGNGGTPYNGMDPALLYSRSSDGGATWDPHHLQLPGTTSDFYNALSADIYTWAEPRGNVIAFGVFDAWHDMFVMKSTDAGDTWEKIMVWEHPYPFFDWDVTITTDTLWAPDNSGDIAIDANGKVHLVCGLTRVMHEEVGTTYQYFPYTDGIAYWNEDRPPFEDANPHDALDAWDVLVEDYNLVGWILDGDILPDMMAYRQLGLVTMPNITITKDNQIIVAFAMTTVGYDNGTYNFKHIWVRGSDNNGDTWLNFYDLNTDLVHIFDECIYPVLAGDSDEAFHLIYNTDPEPGLALDDDHAYVENKWYYSRMLLTDIGLSPPVGFSEKPINEETVSQNYPNPFRETTYVQTEVHSKTTLSLEVTNLMGQVVTTIDKGEVNAGSHTFRISADKLVPGIYFYTVKAGKSTVTKKMIVE